MRQAIRIDAEDNVLVALSDLEPGMTVDGVLVREQIPRGHKFAATAIAAGAPVVKYSYPIGVATSAIDVGAHVHSHNVQSALDANASVEFLAQRPQAKAVEDMPTFEGYRRGDGRVGIRNEIWILTTVGCVNHVAERIARTAMADLGGPDSGIDDVVAFPHPFGCSQLGHDLDNTRRLLAALVHHPNAAAVLVIGLGCENNQLDGLLREAGDLSGKPIASFNAQDVVDECRDGVAKVRELAERVSGARREPVPASELMLGMKCGGSDGLSGITANPLVGRIADRLTALGGTTLLTEVPEMFGAEQALFGRATDAKIAERATAMVNNFRDYFRRYGEPIDENPSPGNKQGGITTLAEKSLGCVQKGGRAPVQTVLDYAERAPSKLGGLALLNAPGNDGVSSTALVAAGAHIVLFTTGRGTPMGFPAPTVKISTNTALAQRKPNWIDFDAGELAEGKASFDELTTRLFDFLLSVASGNSRTKNEVNGFREITIWKDGVTL
jgi:altronate hydrolase